MSSLFKLDSSDLAKGAVVAVLAGVLTYLAAVVQSPNFSFTNIDWNSIIHMAVVSLVAYLGKNLITDSSGKVAGISATQSPEQK